MSFSPLIDQLISGLRCLPGVGSKTAQRMAMHLLERGRDAGLQLSKTLAEALVKIQHCNQCRTYSETSACSICSNPKRDPHVLCVVETPMDLWAIEQSSYFQGRYFVLLGHLSPLDGIGPRELKLEALDLMLENPEIEEVILAISPTVEGQATCHYLHELAKKHKKNVSKIAYGIPFGGELEWVDQTTLNHAFQARQRIE